MPVDQPLVETRCPSCGAPQETTASSCTACGFNLDLAKQRFGAIPRYGIHVTDSTEAVLTLSEYRGIERRLRQFENQFPQSRFSVFFTAMLPGQKLEDYTFWLFNSCHFTPFDSKLSNNFALLLTVDLQSRSACLMIGYGLEPYLSASDLEALAGRGLPAFRKARYADGARAIIAAVGAELRKRIREREPGLPARVPASAAPSPS